MFKLFARKPKPVDGPLFAPLQADVHSHLLFGIDDGAQTTADSLALIQGLANLGYRKLVTTPHIHPQYPNTPEVIRQRLADVQQLLRQQHIDLELEAAAEYYLDEQFLAALEANDLLSFGGANNYLLVETSHINRLANLPTIVGRIRQAGYNPVLAHPERYRYAWAKGGLGYFQELREAGLLMQVNLNSFTDVYGDQVRSMAEQLVEANLVHFLGSDTHFGRHVERLRVAGNHPLVQQLMDSRNLLNLTL